MVLCVRLTSQEYITNNSTLLNSAIDAHDVSIPVGLVRQRLGMLICLALVSKNSW